MHELQQLHGELDVAQPAGTELELPGPYIGRHQLLDAPAHRLHLGHEVLALARRPHHRHQRGDVLLAELGIACRGPRLHQRLELPGLGPALVVGDMRVQRAHQLAVLALRPQRRVDLEERLRGEPHHLAGHPGGDRVGLFGDEDDVDVADVVQLAGTALAHRDHRQPRRLAVFAAHRAGRHLQRDAQRGVGQIRQVDADLGERQHRLVLHRRRQVEAGEHHQPVAVERPQHGQHIVCATGRFDGVGEGGAQFVGRRQRHVSRQQVPGLRVRDQVVAQRQGRTEHTEQPAAQALVFDQRLVEFIPAATGRVGQPHHRPQRGVGVRGARQRPQQLDVRVGVPAEPVQVGRGGRFDQPQPAYAGQLAVAASQVWPRLRPLAQRGQSDR